MESLYLSVTLSILLSVHSTFVSGSKLMSDLELGRKLGMTLTLGGQSFKFWTALVNIGCIMKVDSEYLQVCLSTKNFLFEQLDIQIILTGADRHPDKGLHTYQQYLDHLWQVRHQDTDLHHYQHCLYMDSLWQVSASLTCRRDGAYMYVLSSLICAVCFLLC